jgi:hypothetical protein
MEQWRPATGFEGWYEVSSMGRVRRSRPGKATYVGKILKLHTRKSGHQTVSLRSCGRDRQTEIHRLVAAAFIGACPSGKEVNHIDGKPAHNVPENLEYVTRSENVKHAYRTGLLKARRGEAVNGSKLIAHDIRLIRNSPLGTTALAMHYGVATITIKHIRARRTWKHIS